MRLPWHSPEFKALWDRIKHRTTYHLAFDNEDLLAQCTRALREAPAIPRTRLQWRKAGLAIGRSGVEATGERREGSLFAGDLRDPEGARIQCGKAHFDALGVAEPAARYEVARNLDDLFAGIGA